MLRLEVRHIFQPNFKLGTQTEHEDPHHRQAPWPSRSKLKVARSRDESDRCWPIRFISEIFILFHFTEMLIFDFRCTNNRCNNNNSHDSFYGAVIRTRNRHNTYIIWSQFMLTIPFCLQPTLLSSVMQMCILTVNINLICYFYQHIRCISQMKIIPTVHERPFNYGCILSAMLLLCDVCWLMSVCTNRSESNQRTILKCFKLWNLFHSRMSVVQQFVFY